MNNSSGAATIEEVTPAPAPTPIYAIAFPCNCVQVHSKTIFMLFMDAIWVSACIFLILKMIFDFHSRLHFRSVSAPFLRSFCQGELNRRKIKDEVFILRQNANNQPLNNQRRQLIDRRKSKVQSKDAVCSSSELEEARNGNEISVAE